MIDFKLVSVKKVVEAFVGILIGVAFVLAVDAGLKYRANVGTVPVEAFEWAKAAQADSVPSVMTLDEEEQLRLVRVELVAKEWASEDAKRARASAEAFKVKALGNLQFAEYPGPLPLDWKVHLWRIEMACLYFGPPTEAFVEGFDTGFDAAVKRRGVSIPSGVKDMLRQHGWQVGIEQAAKERCSIDQIDMFEFTKALDLRVKGFAGYPAW